MKMPSYKRQDQQPKLQRKETTINWAEVFMTKKKLLQCEFQIGVTDQVPISPNNISNESWLPFRYQY